MAAPQTHRQTTSSEPDLSEIGPDDDYYYMYAGKTAVVLGSLHVVIGILSILLQATRMLLLAQFANVATGIWCGFFSIIAGSLGVAAGHAKTHMYIQCSMLMSIVSALFNATFIGAIVGLSVAFESINVDNYVAKIAVGSLMLILVPCELVIAIWSMILTWRVTICAALGPQPGVVLRMPDPESSPKTQPRVDNMVQGGTRIFNVVQARSRVDNVVQGRTTVDNVVQERTRVGNVVQGGIRMGNAVQGRTRVGNVVQGRTRMGNVVQGRTRVGNDVHGQTSVTFETAV